MKVNDHTPPLIQHYPVLISFLGYNPFLLDSTQPE